MLYEKKRTFGREAIDITGTSFTTNKTVYAGQAVNETAATAGVIDYEEQNQHFPDENTLEVLGVETAASTGGEATLTITLQGSADNNAWKDEVSFVVAEGDIKEGELIQRFTIPARMGRYMRLKLNVGGEVFTAGKIFALVRPL